MKGKSMENKENTENITDLAAEEEQTAAALPCDESATVEAASSSDLPAEPTAEAAVPAPDIEIIGVYFRNTHKSYYFNPQGVRYRAGDHVIVETARGPEYGTVSIPNRCVPAKDVVQPLKRALRPATPEDDAQYEHNRALEADAKRICREKIAAHKLNMSLVAVEYTFDNSKLLFYFTAEERVDFRNLVKDLASVFHTRIELRQIGIRDEARMIGGLGACGRPFCCSSFLSDFMQVSIKMVKKQNFSLNSAKISGACGRLMCCLRYEYDAYEAAAAEAKAAPAASTGESGDAAPSDSDRRHDEKATRGKRPSGGKDAPRAKTPQTDSPDAAAHTDTPPAHPGEGGGKGRRRNRNRNRSRNRAGGNGGNDNGGNQNANGNGGSTTEKGGPEQP